MPRALHENAVPLRHGPELWDLYARGELKPDSVLTGIHRPSEARVNLRGLLNELEAVERDEMRRRAALA